MKPDKFIMPGEFEKHQKTFISWPVKEALCWPENYKEVCKGYATVARTIADYEPVVMLINPGEAKYAGELCGIKVELLEIEHNDSWIRDNGPTFLIDRQGDIAAVNWKFNAWGGKYSPWDLDDQVAAKLLDKLQISRFDADIVLEGGSIHSDGEGTILTTEECLLNKNRNPHLNREEIAYHVKKMLNAEKIIWLEAGLAGDETDGHIDNIACFAKPGTVILQVCEDPDDPNYIRTQEALNILDNTTDAKGRKLEIIRIKQPPATYYKDARLTLSYLNFYFVNNAIILPIFGGNCKETDKMAIDTLKQCFPDRTIVPLESMSIIREGGNIHCITQQMPSVVRSTV